MKLNEMYPSNLLKAQDVLDAGGEMPVTIKTVEMKTFENESGTETKPIAVFSNDSRMVLNKTNANSIAAILGDDTDGWTGKEIVLIVADVDFQGKQVPAIRIKNLNSKDALIQSYWSKVSEIGLTRQEGLDNLKESKGDFAKALAALGAPF